MNRGYVDLSFQQVRIPAPAGTEILGVETLSLLRREDGCAVYEAVAGSHAVRSGPGRNR